MKKYLFKDNTMRLISLMLIHTLRTIATVGVAMLINMLIDNVSGAISTNDITVLINGAVICVVYAAILGVIVFLSEKLKAANIKQILCHIRRDVMSHIMGMDIQEFQSENSAEYITVLNQNIGVFEENYLKNLLSIYESCISIVGAVALLIYINPLIAVVSIAAMSIPSLVPKLFGKKLGENQNDIMQEATTYNAKIKDAFNGFEVIKSYHMEKCMLEKENAGAEALENSKVRLAGTMAGLYGLANLSSITVQFLIMSLAGIFAVNGLVSIGSIIAITQLTGQVISPAFQLSAKLSSLKSVAPVCKKLEELVVTQNTETTKYHELNKAMRVSELSFSYDEQQVLKDVSIDLEAGKKYAIVGKSGSGKSTLLKVLGGYYKTYDGEVSVDGEENAVCDTAFIQQNVFLFDDTIRNNITLFEEYTNEQIEEVIKLAGLDEMIAELPEGLDTEVQENGSRFSGGEKQRIAIARALLHKKKLFLLDEATSSLDNETANKIESGLLSLGDVTCVSVIHRLVPSVLQKYDNIIVMDKGCVVEKGTFNKLNLDNGIFSELLTAGVA